MKGVGARAAFRLQAMIVEERQAELQLVEFKISTPP